MNVHKNYKIHSV